MVQNIFQPWISKLRYHHIPLDDASIPKTAFMSPQTLAFFPELMNKVLKDLPFTITYLDDIIIYSKTTEDHPDHPQQVFHKLKNARLSMKLTNVISSPKRSNIKDIS